MNLTSTFTILFIYFLLGGCWTFALLRGLGLCSASAYRLCCLYLIWGIVRKLAAADGGVRC